MNRPSHGRPPAPFPWILHCTEGEEFVKGSLRRRWRAALDKFSPLRRLSYEEGKGASTHGALAEPPAGRPEGILPPSSSARCARMRRCLKLRQGASPLRPPAPFPWNLHCTERREFVKGPLSRRQGAALDKFSPLRRLSYEEGKGASMHAALTQPPAGRPEGILPPSSSARCARMRRCLILRQGGKPP